MDPSPASAAASAESSPPGTANTRRRPLWAVVLATVGELLITAGVLVLLLVVYELYITGIYTHEQQHKLEKQLAVQWKQPTPTTTAAPAKPVVPLPGNAVAILHAPRLGSGWKWVVVEGVGTSDLAKGPGHYPGTALPGQLGNFVVSGHRTTHGAPFFHTDSLRPGDAVIVETAADWYVYDVSGHDVVSPSDVGVVLPVPGKPGVAPTQRLLTFTTCNPRYSARQRLIIHGVLRATYPKTGPPPPALTTGLA